MIKDNLLKIKEEIEKAKMHSITKEDVKLVAVSKTRTIEEIKEAIECGQVDFGENRVQELREKINNINYKINYHMIGNLQTNKVKYIYDKVYLIHSLDNLSLAREINKRAVNDNLIVNCLVQVNIGNEPQKGGVSYCDTERFIEDVLGFTNIKINGLMTIAPQTDDEKYLRECFRKMFILKNKIQDRNYENLNMKYLSMGMSSDFKIAIEEGANIVRIGTNIFGKRN